MADEKETKAKKAPAKKPAAKKTAAKKPAAKKAPAKKAEAKPAVKKTAAKKPAAKKKPSGKTVTVLQTGSSIGRPKDQHATLVGLGLAKPGRRSTLEDTPSVRGMINKIQHLVKIVDEDAA